MKKIVILILFTVQVLSGRSQINRIDFGTTNAFFTCDPPVYTTTNQVQCISNNPVSVPIGTSVMYYTTSSGPFGQDCRNWLRLSNPGFPFIGTGSELQLRNAGNGSTTLNPARFVVKDFVPSTKFGIIFDFALAGLGGEFIFRCGSGQTYGDTIYTSTRDTSSFLVLKIDDNNPSTTQPVLTYSGSAANPIWPNPSNVYYYTPGSHNFSVYQRHTLAIFCNNTNAPTVYSYLGLKTLNPQSYDVYLDSVLDADNVVDTLFGLNRAINSFMFCGSNALCANSGPYLGDTLVVDDVRWSSDFITAPLPVRLSNFKARVVSEKEILLSWADMSASNLNSYDVEVSTDGIQFVTVGSVAGSDYLSVYSFMYKAPRCGQYFFRLRFDNTKYSEILPIEILCEGPKIRAGKQFISIDTKSPGTLVFSSTLGQVLLQKAVSVGYSQIGVYVSPGIYLATFIANSKKYTQKIVLQ